MALSDASPVPRCFRFRPAAKLLPQLLSMLQLILRRLLLLRWQTADIRVLVQSSVLQLQRLMLHESTTYMNCGRTEATLRWTNSQLRRTYRPVQIRLLCRYPHDRGCRLAWLGIRLRKFGWVYSVA